MKKRKLVKLLFVLIALSGVVLTSCKDDDDDTDDEPEVNYFQEMKAYMSGNGLDLTDIASGWVATATAAYDAGTENYYIIDLRAAEDFNDGHIEGAHNTALADVVVEAANADKQILLVCYTGQSATHALVGLRLSGYSDCQVLYYGMSSWNSDFDSWTANTGSVAIGHSNWSATNNTESPVTFSYPEFSASSEDGAEILAERVDYMLSEGFSGIASIDVLDAAGDYFININWEDADVDQYGHITGAYRLKEYMTFTEDGFKHLDPSSTVVTYCWTGTGSSLITAYLTVLGYDAKSLKFGANSMIYDDLQGHQWTSDASNDYPVVTSK